ncbi:ATE1 [Bugula neritina]|uniref:ATE1 n=1 Tax=Bugula neritina TaxID=10212 RepID=A0A7J7JSK7_BUGNE|nr:ATE1 [Bugula neritina]
MAESSSSAQSESSSAHQSREKGLADLLEEYDSAVAKHKFELRLVRSHPPSKEFEDSQLEEYEVYKKYQMTVHKDPESKVTFSQFKNFLISSPLVEETRHGVELGSFHYQYILDGKIIAVEVMDILPQFISSKYFFYDPAYDFLTLGTYSTLRSIYFIQQLSQKLPSIQHYLMGFYIHSCLKMNTKLSSLRPTCSVQRLTCVPIEQCLPKLDVSKYSNCVMTLLKLMRRPQARMITN